MNAVRPLLRLAWRDTRSHPLRTLVLALVIGVPAAAITVANIGVGTALHSADDLTAMEIGQAAMRIDVDTGPGEPAWVPDEQPGDVVVSQWLVEVDRGGTPEALTLESGALFDPLLAGRYRMESGRPATAAAEVMVTAAMARRFDMRVGDPLVIDGVAHRVSGVYVIRGQLDSVAAAVLDSGEVSGFLQRVTQYTSAPRPTDHLFSADGSAWAAVWARDESFTGTVPPPVRFAMQMAIAVALLVVALLITSAFASGARRQLREVGLISANGADPRHVRTALALRGTITAAVGIGIGVLIVIVAWVLFADLARRGLNQDVRFRVAPLDLVVSYGSILAAGTLAAWWPARSVSRAPVLAALAGRRPLPEPHLGVPVLGLVAGAVGILLISHGAVSGQDNASTFVLLGATAVIVGVSLSSTWLVAALGGLASRAGGVLRVAGRGLARQRTRTGPLVAAMAIASAAAVLGIVVSRTEMDSSSGPAMLGFSSSFDDVDIRERISAAAPGTQFLVTSTTAEWLEVVPGSVGATSYSIEIIDPDRSDLDEATRRALAAGQVVTTAGGTSEVVLRVYDMNDLGESLVIAEVPLRAVSIAGSVLKVLNVRSDPAPPVFAVAPDTITAEVAQLDLNDGGVIGIRSEAWTEGEIDQLRRIEDDVRNRKELALARGATGEGEMWVDDYASSDARVYRWMIVGLVGFATLLSMVAIGFGMLLSRLEQRDDQAVLHALGATPGFHRRSGMIEAGSLTGLAMVIAIPLGVLVAVVIRNGISDVPTIVPWSVLAMLGVGTPVVAALLFGALASAPATMDPTS